MFSNAMPFEIRPNCIKLNYFRYHHVGVYVVHAVTARVLANYGFVSVVIVSDNLAAFFNGAVVGQSVKINTFIPATDGWNVLVGESFCIAMMTKILGKRAFDDTRVDMVEA